MFQREKLVRYKNMHELTAKIAPWTSLVLRSDLGDMPLLVPLERPVVMSPEQRQAYIQMVAQHLAESDEGESPRRTPGRA